MIDSYTIERYGTRQEDKEKRTEKYSKLVCSTVPANVILLKTKQKDGCGLGSFFLSFSCSLSTVVIVIIIPVHLFTVLTFYLP